ncbi:MAG TPA: DUF512 domain-containing protein [Chloroflexota bacterium]|jgi:putative radical SAM enzyme (TIGR03279 family)|nr:DUF512 domain-containing protein [Chloroflexota bacterium]
MSIRSQPIGAPGDLVDGVSFVGTRARQARPGSGARGGIVESVQSGSPAARAGVKSGDMVVGVDGNRLRDVIDYQFLSAGSPVRLEVVEQGDQHRGRTVEILREDGQSLGITFTQPTFAPIRECNNHCPFCFIDQLPAEMRASLYIRDDDYRYSFLFGNFVTLTNLNERDWLRLEEQRLSPLYVSVHATDLKLRRLLLGNNRAPDILPQLDRLAAAGIRVHTQVVVCSGLNDGVALEQTVDDLAARHPNVISIGVVPVGLTRTPAEILAGPGASCSRILPSAAELDLQAFEPSEAKIVVELVQARAREYRRRHSRALVYASDELYLLAGVPFPGAKAYDGYPQYENGIGMVRDLLDDWNRTRRRIQVKPARIGGSANLVCGEMIAPVLEPIVNEWGGLRGIRAELTVLENTFFGPRVRVSGLLSARDILANRNRLRGDVVILPEVMLDKTGSRLLDNVTPAELESQLGRPVRFAGMMSAVDRIVMAGERPAVKAS